MARKTFFIISAALLFLSFLLPPLDPARAEADRNETEEFDFANGLFSRGMYDMAISGYEEFLKKHPASSYAETAAYRIADSYFLSGKYDESLSRFDDFLKKHPSGDLAQEARLREGQVYFMKNDYTRAEKLLSEVAARAAGSGSSDAAKYYIAAIRFKQGDYTTSRNMLEGIISSSGDGKYASYAYMNLGDIYLEQGQEKKAAEAYGKAELEAPDAVIAAQAAMRAGGAFYNAGDYAKAASFYRKVTENPEENKFYDGAAVGLLTALYKNGEYGRVIEDAKTLMQRAGDKDAKAQMLFIVGNSYFQEDRFPEAEKAYKELSAGYPGTEAALKARSNECWTLYKTGDYAKCLSNIESYPGGEAGQAEEILYIKARALAGLDRPEDALKVYAEIAKKPAGSAYRKEAVYDMGWLYSAAGRQQEAIRYFKMFADEYPKDERSPAVLLKAGQDNLKLKRYREAEKDYNDFLSRFAASPLRENVLYQLGGVYLEEEEYDKAIAAYQKFMKDFPASKARESAVYWTGLAYQRKEDWAKAIETYSGLTAGGKGEFYDRAMESAAYCHFQKGDHARAAQMYYELIKSSPGAKLTQGVYRWVADYYMNGKEYAKSLEVLGALSKGYPDEAASGEVAYMFAENYYGLKDWNKAVKYFQDALSRKVSSPFLERSYLGLGRCYFALGDDKKAMEYLDEAIKGQADNMTGALIRFEIGNVSFSTGDYQEAAKQYLMVAILYENEELCSRALFRAGEAFEKAGARDKSLDAYKELVARYPDNALSRKAAEEITKLQNETE